MTSQSILLKVYNMSFAVLWPIFYRSDEMEMVMADLERANEVTRLVQYVVLYAA